MNIVKVVVSTLAALGLLILPQVRLQALHAAFYDLGQYTTTIHAVAFGGESGQALSGHAHLVMPLYAVVYGFFPGPATLLALQSLILVGSAGLAGIVWKRAGAGPAIDGSLLYLLSISVWFSAIFDFHFEHLLFPLIFGASLGLMAGGSRGLLTTLCCGLALIAVKEAYCLMAMGLGLTAIVTRRWYVGGAVLFVAGATAFLILSGTVIAYYSAGLQAGSLWNGAFGYLGDGVPAMIRTIVLHPLRVAGEMMQPHKLIYVAVLGGAFAGLWVLAPAFLLPAAPILALSLLSRNENHFYLGNQYTVGVVAPLFVASALGIARLPRPWRTRSTMAMVVLSVTILVLFGPSPLSRLFVFDRSFSFGRSAYDVTPRDRHVREIIAATIPSDPAVSVSTQNTVVTAAIAERRALAAFPVGTVTPFPLLAPRRIGLASALLQAFFDKGGSAPIDQVPADYVVIDMTRELYMQDKGCRWDRGGCTDVMIVDHFKDAVASLAGDYDRVVDDDGLLIFRHKRS